MDDERITLRMGKEELQQMDSFLEEHPELGNRSLFVRTAVREYINRDADVSVPARSDGLFVGLTKAQMGALTTLKETGRIYSEEEYIRNILDQRLKNEVKTQQAEQNAYELALMAEMQR